MLPFTETILLLGPCVGMFYIKEQLLPVQFICRVHSFAKSIQQGGMCLEDDNVVDYHGNQHHHHLQLVVNSQKYRARHQTQNTGIDEVL